MPFRRLFCERRRLPWSWNDPRQDHPGDDGEGASVAMSGGRVFGVELTGIMLIGPDHCPCAVRFGRPDMRTFAFEATPLPTGNGPDAETAPLRMSGPVALPVDCLLRSTPMLLQGKSITGDFEYTLLAVVTRASFDHIAFVATVRLRSDDAPSELRIRLAPGQTRSFGFAWTQDWTVDRWLNAFWRISRRCPSFASFDRA